MATLAPCSVAILTSRPLRKTPAGTSSPLTAPTRTLQTGQPPQTTVTAAATTLARPQTMLVHPPATSTTPSPSLSLRQRNPASPSPPPRNGSKVYVEPFFFFFSLCLDLPLFLFFSPHHNQERSNATSVLFFVQHSSSFLWGDPTLSQNAFVSGLLLPISSL